VKQIAPVWSTAFFLALFASGCGADRQWTTDSEEAVRWVETGVQQWQRFYYTDALESLGNAVAADSQFAVAWGRMALVHLWASNMPDARSLIAKAERLSATATPREQQMIRLWSYRINEERAKEASLADSLIRLYPQNSEFYLFRGQCYEFERNFEAAVGMYEEGLKYDTAFALGMMSLGYAHSILGDQDKAVEYMQRYIRMAPQEADPLASYADILVRAGRFDEALEQYRKALTVRPDYWYAVREIGTVYLIKGKLRDAERQFEMATKLLPVNTQSEANLLRLRAMVDLQRGSYEDAVAMYRAARAIDSSYVWGSSGLVTALGKLKRFSEGWEAIDSVRAEIERRKMAESQVMQAYHVMRARLLTEEGKLDEAEEECREAVEFSTPFTRGVIYVQGARIARVQKEWEPALDAIENALRVNPNSTEALLTLALIYHDKGDNQMAREIGRRLLNLWSEADADYRPLAELRAALGKTLR